MRALIKSQLAGLFIQYLHSILTRRVKKKVLIVAFPALKQANALRPFHVTLVTVQSKFHQYLGLHRLDFLVKLTFMNVYIKERCYTIKQSLNSIHKLQKIKFQRQIFVKLCSITDKNLKMLEINEVDQSQSYYFHGQKTNIKKM